jgi:hypothetical protein
LGQNIGWLLCRRLVCVSRSLPLFPYLWGLLSFILKNLPHTNCSNRKTGTSNYVVAHCDAGTPPSNPPSTGNLPGLDATQSKHAQAIIGEAKKEDLGHQGCLAGIATALVEVINIPSLTPKTLTNTPKVQHKNLRQQRRPLLPQLPTRRSRVRSRQCRHLPAESNVLS